MLDNFRIKNMLTRRSLATGLISLVAAPTIVRAGSLMPVKLFKPDCTVVFYRELFQALIIDIDWFAPIHWDISNPTNDQRRPDHAS
jgi:hypothetical protein